MTTATTGALHTTPRRSAVLLGVVVLLIALARPAVRAVADDAPAAMSPDEAALQFRPYVLTKDTAPDGYTADAPGVWTPASMAFFDRSGASPLAALATYQDEGLLIHLAQSLNHDLLGASTIVAAPLHVNYHAYLMQTADDAQAVVQGVAIPIDPSWPNVQTLGTSVSLGDGGELFDLSGGNEEALEYRWRRGNVALEVFTTTFGGGPAGLLNVATAIDATVASAPPIDLSTPAMTPPASEAARLQALLRMSTIDLPPTAIPADLTTDGPVSQLPAGAVLVSSQPERTLQVLDEKWQRLADLSYVYTSDTSSTRYAVDLDEDATADAQAVDLRDFSLSGNPPPVEPSPVALGDDAFLLRGRSTGAGGTTRDYVEIVWRHGALALAVEISGDPGTVKDADVAAFARALDLSYQQSAYAAQPLQPAQASVDLP